MKKYDAKFIIIELLIMLVIAVIPSSILGISWGSSAATIIGMTIFFYAVLNLFYWLFLGTIITNRIVMKTEDKYSGEKGYVNCETFYSHSEIFMVDVERGKIAYIANQNPYEFQEVNAAELTDAKSGYIPAPLGGTSYVYFEFKCNGKRKRIPTFTSSQPYMLKSGEVLEGLSKADYFCEVINQAKGKR